MSLLLRLSAVVFFSGLGKGRVEDTLCPLFAGSCSHNGSLSSPYFSEIVTVFVRVCFAFSADAGLSVNQTCPNASLAQGRLLGFFSVSAVTKLTASGDTLCQCFDWK